MKHYLEAAIVLTLLLPAGGMAQNDATRYMDAAQGSALLYRGHKAFSYTQAFNGTYFWSDPAFETGEVVYNGKRYSGVLLNVDAARQDLLVKTPTGELYKVLASAYVDRFSMGGRQFFNLKKRFGGSAPDGYWELLHDGRAKAFKQVRRTLQQDLDGHLRTGMGYEGGNYNPKIHNIFLYSVSYCYVSEEGRIVPIRRRGQLLNQYKDKKREIKRHLAALERNRSLNFEQFCKEVLSYAESL